MIKNMNDIVSFIALIAMVIYCMRFFMFAFVINRENKQEDITSFKGIRQLIRDYNDNTEN